MPTKDEVETCLIDAFLSNTDARRDDEEQITEANYGPASLDFWHFDRTHGLWKFPLGFYDEMSEEYFLEDMEPISTEEMHGWAAVNNIPLPCTKEEKERRAMSMGEEDKNIVARHEECEGADNGSAHEHTESPLADAWYEDNGRWCYIDSVSGKKSEWIDEVLWAEEKPSWAPVPAIGLKRNGRWSIFRQEDVPSSLPEDVDVTYIDGEWYTKTSKAESGMEVGEYLLHVLDSGEDSSPFVREKDDEREGGNDDVISISSASSSSSSGVDPGRSATTMAKEPEAHTCGTHAQHIAALARDRATGVAAAAMAAEIAESPLTSCEDPQESRPLITELTPTISRPPVRAVPKERRMPRIPGSIMASIIRQNMKRNLNLGRPSTLADEDTYVDRSAKRRAIYGERDVPDAQGVAFDKTEEIISDTQRREASAQLSETCMNPDGSFAGQKSSHSRAGVGHRG